MKYEKNHRFACFHAYISFLKINILKNNRYVSEFIRCFLLETCINIASKNLITVNWNDIPFEDT